MKKSLDYNLFWKRKVFQSHGNTPIAVQKKSIQNPNVVAKNRNLEQIDLWTWIKGGKSNKALYKNSPDERTINRDEFIDLLGQKLVEDNVPIGIKKVKVNWNNGKEQTEEYMVDFQSNSYRNPLSMLIQYEEVGIYTFVGVNTFISPPRLPKVPGEKIKVPEHNGLLFFGIAIMTLFMIVFLNSINPYGASGGNGLLWIVLACGCIGAYQLYKKVEAKSYNNAIEEERTAWDHAWTRWQDDQVEYAFQQRANGKLDCIMNAVEAVMKEVCDDIFNNKPVIEEKKEIEQKELEEAIALRRQALE